MILVPTFLLTTSYLSKHETLKEISQCDPNILEIRGEHIGNKGLKEFEHEYK